MMRQLDGSAADLWLIDRVVGELDVAVRAGRIVNALLEATSQQIVRLKLRTACLNGHVYSDGEFFIFAEPGQLWFSPVKALFEQLVFPLTPSPAWQDVPRRLRDIARMHSLKYVLFGDMFGVASRSYRQCAGVRPLSRGFITST